MLLPPQSINKENGVERVFNTLRLIQYDPLNPCGRNTDLVLQVRIKDYHPDEYYHWLYDEKKGIECYDKELCIIPVEDFPLITHRQQHTQKHPYWQPFLKKYQAEIEEILKYINTNGPVTSADIDNKKRIAGNWSENASVGRVALDMLWRMGRLTIVKREKGRKYYDLISHAYNTAPSSGKTALAYEHILRRVNSVGLLRKSGTDEGWQGLRPTKDKTNLVNQLLKEEQLLEVVIEESKTQYIALAEDQHVLESSLNKHMQQKKMVFLAPLDNLIWDRGMIHDLFGFFYRWEVYTPLAKRQYGYYVLPILFGDRLIGRIEPVLTKNKHLEIKGFWREESERWEEPEYAALEKALHAFKKYLRAQDIINPPHR